jgi:hypothetical protein
VDAEPGISPSRVFYIPGGVYHRGIFLLVARLHSTQDNNTGKKNQTPFINRALQRISHVPCKTQTPSDGAFVQECLFQHSI